VKVVGFKVDEVFPQEILAPGGSEVIISWIVPEHPERKRQIGTIHKLMNFILASSDLYSNR
jgi:hypothetical protein